MKSREYWLKELYLLIGETEAQLELDRKNQQGREQMDLFKKFVARIQNDARKELSADDELD